MNMPDGNTARQIVDALTYANYAFNRRRSPDITPERWARIYPNAQALESRYQAEAAIAADREAKRKAK